MKTAGILLAAGASRRFGSTNKLLALLGGRPFVSYAARTLRDVQPDMLIAVANDPAVSGTLEGYDVVEPDAPDPGQADSLRAEVWRAEALGANRLLIALGDMPYLTAALLARVAGLCTNTRPSAATDGQIRIPPVCFPKSFIPDLLAPKGDRGAASLLKNLPEEACVAVDVAMLRDIDTPEKLHAAIHPAVL